MTTQELLNRLRAFGLRAENLVDGETYIQGGIPSEHFPNTVVYPFCLRSGVNEWIIECQTPHPIRTQITPISTPTLEKALQVLLDIYAQTIAYWEKERVHVNPDNYTRAE